MSIENRAGAVVFQETAGIKPMEIKISEWRMRSMRSQVKEASDYIASLEEKGLSLIKFSLLHRICMDNIRSAKDEFHMPFHVVATLKNGMRMKMVPGEKLKEGYGGKMKVNVTTEVFGANCKGNKHMWEALYFMFPDHRNLKQGSERDMIINALNSGREVSFTSSSLKKGY